MVNRVHGPEWLLLVVMGRTGQQTIRTLRLRRGGARAEVVIDISNAKPKRLTAKLVEEANARAGCGENVCQIVPKEVIDWDLEDPSVKSMERAREIRDQIRDKIHGLLEYIDKK
jgi:protein-tyrosine-phosphatase